MNAVVAFWARFMGVQAAIKFSAYTTMLTIFLAFLGTVYVCINSLYTMAASAVGTTTGSGSGFAWVSMFWMGLGIFIPANAGAVMACIASVWIGCGIYQFQRDSVRIFAH